jgi:cystathionine beta-lyase
MNYTKEYFDYLLDRRNTNSMKWDGSKEKFNVSATDFIPMWIADMDFRCPQEVIEAVVDKAKIGAYGYSTKPDSFYQTIINWVDKHYHWQVKKEWIIFTPGVIPGYTIAIQQLTNPGDGIIVQQPVYYPFMDGVKNNGRKLIVNPLIEKNGFWMMDFEDLEKKAKDTKTKLMILSNPHNPVGRSWTKEELERVGNICADNDVILCSDEIHADIEMKGHHHQAVSAISEKIKNNTITHYAPSKTFNMAGIQTAYVIIPNPIIRKQIEHGMNANRIYNLNFFGDAALEAAYNESGNYVQIMCDYVNGNMDYMKKYIDEKLPMLKMEKPEATYMVWIDFKGTGLSTEEIEKFIVEKAHIGVDMGSWFGQGGAGYLRFNVACPRSILVRAMEQLEQALKFGIS